MTVAPMTLIALLLISSCGGAEAPVNSGGAGGGAADSGAVQFAKAMKEAGSIYLVDEDLAGTRCNEWLVKPAEGGRYELVRLYFSGLPEVPEKHLSWRLLVLQDSKSYLNTFVTYERFGWDKEGQKWNKLDEAEEGLLCGQSLGSPQYDSESEHYRIGDDVVFVSRKACSDWLSARPKLSGRCREKPAAE